MYSYIHISYSNSQKSLEIQEKFGLFKTQQYEILVTVTAWKITRTAEQGHFSFF